MSSTRFPLPMDDDDDNDTNQNVTSIMSSSDDNDTNQNVTNNSLNDDTYNEEDYRDISDDEEEEEEVDDDEDTLMGRASLCSDAAVVLPKRNSSFQQSLRRTVEAPRRVARNLSFGSASLSFAGSASTAAVAALASVAQSSSDDDDDNGNSDHPTVPRRGASNLAPAHVPHRGRRSSKTGVRRMVERSLSGGSVKLRQAVAAAAASVTSSSQRTPPNHRRTGERTPLTKTTPSMTAGNDNSDSDGEEDDYYDYDDGNASMMPVVKIKSSKKTTTTTMTAAAAVTTTTATTPITTAKTEVLSKKKPSSSSTPPSTRKKTLRSTKGMQDRSTSRRTLRTESANSTDEDDLEMGGVAPFELKSGVTGRSTTMDSSSRHNNRGGRGDDTRSNRSNKTTRTLADIRKAKLLQEQQETDAAAVASNTAGRPIWCCGLSKCGWSIMLLLAVSGFGAGFLYPILRHQQGSDNNLEVVTDPPHPGGHQDYEPPVPLEGVDANDSTPVFTPLDPGDEYGQGDGAYYGGGSSGTTTLPPQGPPPSPIDVWNLFHNKTTDVVATSMPSASELSTLLANGNAVFSESHLQQAARHFVQKTIHANIRKPLLRILKKNTEDKPDGGAGILQPKVDEVYEYQNTDDTVIPFADTPLAEYDSEMPYPRRPVSASPKFPHGDVAQWESLMESAGVHVSDIIQWDRVNDLLYVGHGQHVDVIDTVRGTLRTTLKLPIVENINQELRSPWLVPPSVSDNEWKPAPPEPFIEQLLLTSDGSHLVVIVSDYSSIHASTVKPLLKESLVTRLWTYQLTHETLAENNVVSTSYEVIGKTNDTEEAVAAPHVVHGRVIYAAQATANQHIHVVTSSQIDTDRLLQNPLERLHYPDHDRHDLGYAEEIIQTAHDKYIPLYTKRLLREIQGMAGDNQVDNDLTMWPLTAWIDAENNIVDMADLTDSERQMQHLVMAQEHLQEVIVVTSLSIVPAEIPVAGATTTEASRASTAADTSMAAVSTAFLAPTSVEVVGSTDTQLILSVPGYQWTTTATTASKVLQEATHIVQLELGTIRVPGTTNYRAATRFLSTAAFTGRLVQASARESTEIRGDDLRMATVVTKQWNLATTDAGETIVEQTAVKKSYIHVVGVDNLEHRRGSPLTLFDGETNLISAVSFLESFAYVFPSTASKSEIQVVDLGSSSIVVDGGEKFSIRIHLAGSVDAGTNGLSPYLHNLENPDSDGMFLVSIGENKTAESSMGWMISVWDASNPVQLTPLVQYSLEATQILTSWKPRTFRVTSKGQIVLPITTESLGSISSQQTNMKGFLVLNVSPTEIAERARIAHNPATTGKRDCIPGDSGCTPQIDSLSLLATTPAGNHNLLTLEGNRARSTILGDQQHTEAWALVLQ